MKKVFLFLSASALVLSSCVGNPDGKKADTTDSVEVAAAAQGESLSVNTAASKVEWLGKKVSGQHNGTVDIKSGNLIVADGKLTGGTFVADLTSINVLDLEGEYKGKLEDHLKSADFFDVANHPEASFEITNVADAATAGNITVSGNLTIRGTTKNITFDAQVSELTQTSAKVFADFNIAREDWGITYSGQADDLISKEINLKVTLLAGAATATEAEAPAAN